MIKITENLEISDSEIKVSFIRASGPGGQNVNKVATAVQLRFDVSGSTSLTPEVKARLLKLAHNQITNEGILLIEARRCRTQEQNRADAMQRLVLLIRRALQPPKKRRPTRPTAASREKRLQQKRKRSALKQQRRASRED